MNIAIIGAGPAGIISARNAIKAGHSVVLFEKNTRIGGIWNPWSEPPRESWRLNFLRKR